MASEETAAANALADEIGRLRGDIAELRSRNTSLREALILDQKRLVEAWTDIEALRKLIAQAVETIDSYGEISTPLAALAEHLEVGMGKPHPGAALLAQIRRAASHLPGNPDAAEAVLSQLLGEG